MAMENLAEVVRSLPPQGLEAVLQFIGYLKRKDETADSPSTFVHAADEFIVQHPYLLQRLAR